MNKNQKNPDQTPDERAVRLGRLQNIIDKGLDPYPSQTNRTHTTAAARADFAKLEKSETSITLAGRLKGKRGHGGSMFANLEDGAGNLQIYFKKDELGEDAYRDAQDLSDVGDFLEVEGKFFTTKKGEQTLLVENWRLLAKSILPLPEKWHGLSDVETRFRKRYLDLIANEEVREIFRIRAKIMQTIRSFMIERDYLEVETPILQPIPGGAMARPFVTHHNALDADFYLQIAPELYLKRLIVGGYERVFTFARCFRNEGIDWSHNPEFTMLEFYQAYMDYNGMMEFTEDLILDVLENVFGKPTITYGEHNITFKKPFKRITFRDAVKKFAKVDIEDYPDQESIYKLAKKLGLKDVKPADGRGKICDELYKEFARPHFIEPILLIDHPVELSPLAKKKAADPRYVERLQLVAGGFELCNAFSELNDPIDQLERFQAQKELAKKGDAEAHPVDMDFVEALEHGLPPTAGNGIGIDRLTAFLTNTRNIKEVILFPTLRPINPSS